MSFEWASALVGEYRYLVLLAVAIVEGPIASLAAGYLVRLGEFTVAPAYLLLVCGDFIPDVVYCCIGRFGARTKFVARHREKFASVGRKLDGLADCWNRHPGKSMVLAKFAYGLSTPLLLSAGLSSMPVRRFVRYALPITLAQHVVTMSIGYLLGDSFVRAGAYLRHAGWLISGIVILLIGAYAALQRQARRVVQRQVRQVGLTEPRPASGIRIALCSDIYLPQLSGVADSIASLACELRALGHVVRIYAPHVKVAAADADADVRRLRSYSVPGTHDGLILVAPFGMHADLAQFRPDVIHTHTCSTVGLFALASARRLDVPLVGTDHTFPADYLHYLQLNWGPFRWATRKWSSWYYERCSYVTAPSRSMLEELQAYGFSRPCRVVSNPIDTELFRPLLDRDPLKKRLGLGKRCVLLFGRIAIEKKVDRALTIFAGVKETLDDAQLLVVGDGPQRKSLEARCAALKLQDSVRFTGTLRGELLVETLNAADVYLIASTSETQSMTTLQAMAIGLPVVGCAAGGLPEYIHGGETGYIVSADDIAGFVCSLVKLLENPDLATRMGAAGRIRALDYASQRTAAAVDSIYREASSMSPLGSATIC